MKVMANWLLPLFSTRASGFSPTITLIFSGSTPDHWQWPFYGLIDISVTRLGDFYSSWVDIFSPKVAQICIWLFGFFENIFLGKNCWGYFLGNLWSNLGSFYILHLVALIDISYCAFFVVIIKILFLIWTKPGLFCLFLFFSQWKDIWKRIFMFLLLKI